MFAFRRYCCNQQGNRTPQNNLQHNCKFCCWRGQNFNVNNYNIRRPDWKLWALLCCTLHIFLKISRKWWWHNASKDINNILSIYHRICTRCEQKITVVFKFLLELRMFVFRILFFSYIDSIMPALLDFVCFWKIKRKFVVFWCALRFFTIPKNGSKKLY